MICILTISRVTGEIKFRRQLGIAVRSSDSRSRLVGIKLYLCCLKAPWLQTSNLPYPYHWFLIWNREKGKILCSILHLILAKRPRRDSERDGNTRPPGLPLDKPVCRLEATVRTGHGTTDWFQIGKGVCQGPYIVTLLIYLICRVHHEKCWTGRSTSWSLDCRV